jgi:hypothetical protein
VAVRKNPVELRASLFRKTDDGAPELLESPDVQMAGSSDGYPARHPGTSKRIKRTFHLDPDVVLLLSEVQVAEQRRTGQKPELSELVSQAIRQLGEHHAADS